MTARKRAAITSWQCGRHTSALKGSVRVIHPVLTKLEVPWMWDAQAGCYLVPGRAIDDVLAALDAAGYRVEYLMAGW